MMAAVVKAPAYYSPAQNYDKAVERRNVVLRLMEKEGYISHDEYVQAVSEKLVIRHDIKIEQSMLNSARKSSKLREVPIEELFEFLTNCDTISSQLLCFVIYVSVFIA